VRWPLYVLLGLLFLVLLPAWLSYRRQQKMPAYTRDVTDNN